MHEMSGMIEQKGNIPYELQQFVVSDGEPVGKMECN